MKQKSMLISLIVILSLLLAGLQPAIPVAAAAEQDKGGIPEVPIDGLDGTIVPSFTTCTGGTIASSRISASADDAEEDSSSSTVSLANTSLQKYRSSIRQWWGVRFQNVNVPQGAAIVSATITFQVAGFSLFPASMTLWGQLATNPVAFSTANNNITSVSGRPRTTASAAWTMSWLWINGDNYETAELAPIVQEIVNQSGWVANNSMVIVGQATASVNKSVYSYDGSSSNAPYLRICYTTNPTSYSLAASASPTVGGTVSPTSGSYPTGTTVTLTATPLPGYIFVGWTGDYYGKSNPVTITMEANKTVTASFISGSCTTTSVELSEDTYLDEANSAYNYGGFPSIRFSTGTGASPGASNVRHGSLLRWNVSCLPEGATVQSAYITLYVTQLGIGGGVQTYHLYNLRRDWVEGTRTTVGTGIGASWTYYGAGTGNWGIVGAANITSDRYNTNLWNADSSSFDEVGSTTVNLNSAGVEVVQGWISGTTSNYGMVVQNYTDINIKQSSVASSENTTYPGPTLNITYCAPSPTAVTLSSFSDVSSNNGVLLDWTTATEVGLLGFNLYRSDELAGVKQKLNVDLIPALTPGDLLGNAYQFADGTAVSGSTYTYWIELVMLDGNQLSDPVTLQVPYWLRLPLISR